MSTNYDREEEEISVGKVLDYRADGLILTVADPADSRALDMLDRFDVPYVLVYNQPNDARRPTVTVDNVQAGRDVASALIAHGPRKLAVVSGTTRSSDRADARRQGFEARIMEQGLPQPQTVEVDYASMDVDGALADLFQSTPDIPTGLFCTNDLLAMTVIGACGRIGIRVPDDVSIVGFDGIGGGAQLHPTLATVVQPSREMGRVATHQLLAQIAGEAAPGPIILPHHLRIGESAGPPASKAPPSPITHQHRNRSISK